MILESAIEQFTSDVEAAFKAENITTEQIAATIAVEKRWPDLAEAYSKAKAVAKLLKQSPRTANEVVLPLTNGCSLRSGAEHVRLCDDSGQELLRWNREEWQSCPALVMGAINDASVEMDGSA